MAVFEIQLGLLASLQFVVFVFVTGGILGYLAALHAFKQYREKTVRIKAIEKLSNATPEELKLLLAEVPSWVRSSEVEKAAWLSNGVRSMWPFLDKAISADVVSAVNPILESIVKDIPILNKLALRKTFTLGPVAPHITGVKHVKSPMDEVILDLSLRWAGTPSVHLDVATSVSPNLAVAVDDLVLEATVRIILKPLCNVWPTFSAITIAMVEKPRLNAALKAIGGADIMKFPGLGDTLMNVITNLSFDFMTWPERLVIPILDLSEEELRGLENKPTAVLQVKVISASNIPNVDTFDKTDPFVETTVRGKRWHRTSTKNNDLNPVWNENFVMFVEDVKAQHLKIKLSDDGAKARLLGSASIPLSSIEFNKATTHEVLLKGEYKSLAGSVMKGIKRYTQVDDGTEQVRGNKKGGAGTVKLEVMMRPIRVGEAEAGEFYGGMVTLHVERCDNLITKQSFQMKPSPRLRAFCNVPGQPPIPRNIFKGEVKKKTHAPLFDERFELIVYDIKEEVTIQVEDSAYRKQCLLGEYKFPITDVISAAGDEFKGVFKLRGVRSGDIRIHVRYAAFG